MGTNSTAAGTHGSSAGTYSNIWQAVVDQARDRDVQLVEAWQRSMDVLLLFVREYVITSSDNYPDARFSSGRLVRKYSHSLPY